MINKFKPIKVSSLEEAESIENLYSLGVDNTGRSVKVPIDKLRGNEGPQGPQGIAGDTASALRKDKKRQSLDKSYNINIL